MRMRSKYRTLTHVRTYVRMYARTYVPEGDEVDHQSALLVDVRMFAQHPLHIGNDCRQNREVVVAQADGLYVRTYVCTHSRTYAGAVRRGATVSMIREYFFF